MRTYQKDLKECLLKESVEELDKFFEDHQDVIGKQVAEQWKVASDTVKQVTLYKMIYNRIDLPTDLRQKARLWLIARGCRTTI